MFAHIHIYTEENKYCYIALICMCIYQNQYTLFLRCKCKID